MFNSKKASVARIETLIGRNTVVEGNVTFTGGLHVDGCIKGNVIGEEGTPSVLTLSENGRIEGEVIVPHVVLNGIVIGDVHALERIVWQPKPEFRAMFIMKSLRWLWVLQ